MGKTVFIREPVRLTIMFTDNGERVRFFAGEDEISSLREISINGKVFKCLAQIRPVMNEKYGTDNEEAQTIYHVEWNGNRIPVHVLMDNNIVMTALYTVRIR